MAAGNRDEQGMNYSFRFTRLEEAKAGILAEVLSAYEPVVRQRFDKQGYCLSLALTGVVAPETLTEAMRQHDVEAGQVDVLASLLAERDSDIIDVPEAVLRVLRATGSKLTFSFTWVGEE